MANEHSTELKTHRNSLYSQWIALPLTDEKYKVLKSQIDDIDSKIYAQDVVSGLLSNKRIENDLANPGKEYDPNLAVYVDKGTIADNKAALKRLSGYPARKPGEEITDPQELADIAWRNKELKSPIDGAQWLSNVQVEAATGEKVSIGTDGLNKLLDSKKNDLPTSFAHIITGPNDDNHFVSFDIREGKSGKTEITFVDSNGELMPPSERAAILKKFPGAEIKYLNKDGEKISEKEAAQDPDGKLLRVQYDGHNCGLYTSNFVNMLNVTNGDPALIKAGVEQIKEISANPSAHRKVLSQELGAIANDNRQEQGMHTTKLDNMLEKIMSRASGQERQLQKSASVSSITAPPARLAEKSASVDYAKHQPDGFSMNSSLDTDLADHKRSASAIKDLAAKRTVS